MCYLHVSYVITLATPTAPSWLHVIYTTPTPGAAWSLAQLRCPNTVALDALSAALLQPTPYAGSAALLRERRWRRAAAAAAAQSGPSAPRLPQRQRQQQQHDSHLLPLERYNNGSSSSSSSSTSGARTHHSHVCSAASGAGAAMLSRHPRVGLLRAEHVARLVLSCVMVGWAPPQLLAVLAVRGEQLMPSMDGSSLAEVRTGAD